MEENSSIKVSVCISVHNTGKLLPRCLDSVVQQTLKSLEIVIVNNGSTDNSEEIMYDYANRYPERKFVIKSQEDRSLAGGRLTGINNASGRYIVFLDADDYVMPRAYEKMYLAALKNDADIVEVETTKEGTIIASPFNGLKDSKEVLRFLLSTGHMPGMLWLRMYKSSLFNKPCLPTFYCNNEDDFTLPCLLYSANNIYFLHEPLHIYTVDNEQGVMNNIHKKKEGSERRLRAKLNSLRIYEHVKHYIGDTVDNRDIIEALKISHSRRIRNILTTSFPGMSFEDKMSAISKELGQTPDQVLSFLKVTPSISRKVTILERTLGVRLSTFILRML